MNKTKKKIETRSKWNFTAASIAEFFGIADRTVRQWHSEGMPKAAHGKYNLLDCFYWWQDNINKSASDIETNAREKYWAAKAEREELAVKQLKSEVIERREIEKEWYSRLLETIKGIEAQNIVFPGLLANKDKEAIRGIVVNYNRRMRENYSRAGKFTPVMISEDELNCLVNDLTHQLSKFYGHNKKKTKKRKK